MAGETGDDGRHLGEGRDRLFVRTARRYPFFADHQSQVTSKIPVVALIGR